MNNVIEYMVFLFVLSGCSENSFVAEGEVSSSKQIDQEFTEHLIKTSHDRLPYYILRSNKSALQVGDKVALELPSQSVAHIIY